MSMEHSSHHPHQHSCHGSPTDHAGHASMIQDYRRRFWISLLLTIPVILLTPMMRDWLHIQWVTFPGDQYVLLILATIIFMYGGWPFLKGLVTEVLGRRPGMMTLIALAITVAYVYSVLVVLGLSGPIFFWELATLIDIMLLGHWIEMKSILGAGKALEQLAALMPAQAHKLTADGGIVNVSINELKVGDKVLVKPGEKIPADGVVIKGESSVNEAMLTGESQPVVKQPGAQVFGGAVNAEGSLTIEVKKIGKDSFLAQVIALVKEAQESKSKTQDIANRAASWLTWVALTGGILTLIIWVFFSQQGFAFALERTVTVMVITCPHALGLAVPLVVAVSTAIAAQHGLLIRNRSAFEVARKVNAMIFDKTGTLTEGKFGITDIIVLDDTFSKSQLLDYAAAVEAHSEHPIAKAIAASVSKPQEVTAFQAMPGKGAQGKVNNKSVKIVSPGYLQVQGLVVDDPRIAEINMAGKTVVYIIIDDKVKGVIGLADIVRPEAKAAIQRLQKLGVQCLMLTGDNHLVAKSVAEQLGLNDYFAEVLPQDKVAKVKEIQARGLLVAMTGDGVNDAPALAQADVGIAIGAGTDVALATADIILVRSNPLDAVAVITLARSTTQKIIQNLFWATGYNILAIPLAAGVLFKLGILLSPALGAVLMSLSTVIVAINAKLLRINPKE